MSAEILLCVVPAAIVGGLYTLNKVDKVLCREKSYPHVPAETYVNLDGRPLNEKQQNAMKAAVAGGNDIKYAMKVYQQTEEKMNPKQPRLLGLFQPKVSPVVPPNRLKSKNGLMTARHVERNEERTEITTTISKGGGPGFVRTVKTNERVGKGELVVEDFGTNDTGTLMTITTRDRWGRETIEFKVL